VTSERVDEVLGTVLHERFRVEALLGTGHAGGLVFRGRDAEAGATVVVRCPEVPTGLAGRELAAALARFTTEAKQLEALSRESTDIEQLLAAGVAETPGGTHVPYTVFEWLAGRSLERYLGERGPGGGSIGEALVILEPAARALAAAHAMGIAHRDVRPANLWLAEIGGRTSVKVAAFEMATRLDGGDPSFAPEYGAPEHFKRSYGAVGPATDVYGLALCIVELVTGRRALDGADAAELYLATSDLARRPTLRGRGAHVSDAVESVLQRALAVDPRRRWGSARELWDALVDAVPEMTPAAPSVRLVKTTGRPPGVHASPPASVPPGVLGRMTIAIEDARLGDSVRSAAATRSVLSEPPAARSVERTSPWAWIAVGAAAAVAVAVVVAKLGSGGSGPRAANAATTASARASAVPSLRIDEAAVRVAPFTTDMIRIPAGKLTMGSDRDGKTSLPAHAVTLSHAYYIDRTEVRADAYAACVRDGACTANRVHAGDVVESTWGCNTEQDRPTHPANCVDRAQAEAYCAYVKKRLPTEAEWEHAARGSDGREYPWGTEAPTSCAQAVVSGVAGECSDRKGTLPTGTAIAGASAFGLLDMAGNVWEWVADGYEPYPSSAVVDPKVPLGAGGRGVLRGGSWDYAATSAKSTYRLPFQASSGNVSIGFRCARDAD